MRCLWRTLEIVGSDVRIVNASPEEDQRREENA